MACHQFPMVGYIHLMDTGNLPSCESCGKMLLTSKSGNQEEQHVLRPCFPEKARPWAECLRIVDRPRLQEVESWPMPWFDQPTRSCRSATSTKLGAMARKGGLCQSCSCCRCSVPIVPLLKNPCKTTTTWCEWDEDIYDPLCSMLTR